MLIYLFPEIATMNVSILKTVFEITKQDSKIFISKQTKYCGYVFHLNKKTLIMTSRWLVTKVFHFCHKHCILDCVMQTPYAELQQGKTSVPPEETGDVKFQDICPCRMLKVFDFSFTGERVHLT